MSTPLHSTVAAPLPLSPELVGIIRAHAAREAHPFYLYQTATIRRVCRALQDIPYPHTAVHFAIQANAHPRVLAIAREEGLGLFVNSLLHLRHALAHGFAGDQIVFTASAMEAATMREVHAAGSMVNLDSSGQICQWLRLFPEASFGIRSNIGSLVTPHNSYAGSYIGKESRLGLLPDELMRWEGHPQVAGLHLYAGTNIQTIDYFRTCYEALASFVSAFPNLSYLNVGGGFALFREDGVEFDFVTYGAMVTELMTRTSTTARRSIRLVLEPGRILAGNAGVFVSRVVDVKMIDGRQFVGVNASTAQFPRPLFHPESVNHPIAVLPAEGDAATGPGYPSTIYGCSTYSRDYLAADALLPRITPGDLVVLGEAGSYSAAAYTQFLGFPPAKEYFV